MPLRDINRRLALLEKRRHSVDSFPSCSDDMILWLQSLSSEKRERLQAEAHARALAWELETYSFDLSYLENETEQK